MRSAIRFLVPLLVFLALIALGAAELATRSARAWAEKDLDQRARLVLSGARGTLVSCLESRDRRKGQALLDDLVRDERLLGATLCDAGLHALSRSGTLPEGTACGSWDVTRIDPLVGWNLTTSAAGGTVHVSALPIEDGGSLLGHLVLVHDMSYADRRASTTRQAMLLAFGLVGAAAAAATLLAARFSRRSWSAELLRLLPRVMYDEGPATPAPREFQPVLSDVRDLLARLAAEEAVGSIVPWSAERLRHVLRRNLRGEGVLVVANREPYIHERGEDARVRVVQPASGLVTALEPVVRACSGTWIAHGSGSGDREVVDGRDHVRVPPGEESYTLRRVWLEPEQERGYYYGFANEGLWPLCHLADARPEFRIGDWEHYQRVNRLFADVAVEEAKGTDPIVLVQDYHFALVPRRIRQRLPRATILSFWHIPWPGAERFGICPWERRLLEGLLGSSIIGFQTQAHCNNFLDSVDRYLEARIDRERQSVVMSGGETLVRPYPISIEWPSRWLAALPSAPACREAVRAELGLPADALVGVGVDRIDYTKGIAERFLAVERLLEQRPEYRGRFRFVELAAPSRSLIGRYRELDESIGRLAERINQRFGEGAYRPIVLRRAHHPPAEVFRHYRAADFCYVSSLHDGMNLVAKEFVAARDDLRGVLVLSRFTGAARELTEALVVNPYDLEAASAAMHAALSMAPDEQEERMTALRALVAEFNVYRWAGRMLLDAARLRRRDRLSLRLGTELRSQEEAERSLPRRA